MTMEINRALWGRRVHKEVIAASVDCKGKEVYRNYLPI